MFTSRINPHPNLIIYQNLSKFVTSSSSIIPISKDLNYIEKANAISNRDINNINKESNIKRYKRYPCMFLIGYKGTEYKGIQYSPLNKTIEGELYNIFSKLDMVHTADTFSFRTASRTDKGVHSSGNLVFAFARLESKDLIDGIKNKLNELLPEDIKCFKSIRSTPSYNPRTTCNGRRYKYILPLNSLPKEMIQDLDQLRIEKLALTLQEKFQIFVGNLNFHNFTKNASGQLKSKKIMKILKEEKAFNKHDDIDFSSYKSKVVINSTAHNLEDLVDESEEDIYKALDAMENSTLFKSDTFKRTIKSITVTPVYINNECKGFTIELIGVSFLLSQIRKIIGSVLAVLHGAWNSSILELSLKSEYRIPAPMAPGYTLSHMFLKGAFCFDKLINNNPSYDPLPLIDGTDVAMEDYYEKDIVNHIFELFKLKEASDFNEDSFAFFIGTKIWDRQISPRVLLMAETRHIKTTSKKSIKL